MDYFLLIQALCWVGGFAAVWLMGNETLWGPVASFLSGVPFLLVYYHSQAYFVMPMTILLMGIDVRNFFKWRREGIGWRWWYRHNDEKLDVEDLISSIEPTDTPFLRSLNSERTED